MVTEADADLRAFGAAVLDAPAAGAGTVADASCGWVEVSAPEPAGDVAGAAGLFGLSAGGTGGVGAGAAGVVVVVVVASVVVPASCAAEIAGIAQLNARTNIPPARALLPFIHRIVRGIDS
ncbi:MAG TPA: hypothetical protein VFN72_03520 [Solirubrobacterales bacterium]|nr:hypothetical protein [Solirubrobacterales bacterium]